MAKLVYADDGRLLFTEEMKKDYTILAPMMLPVHFALLTKIFKRYGYNLKILDTKDPSIVTEGLHAAALTNMTALKKFSKNTSVSF